jgi:hypothetical protein
MIMITLSSTRSHSRQQHLYRLHAGLHSYLPSIFQLLRKLLLLGALFMLFSTSGMAMSDDHDRAKELLDDGIVQPLETILDLYVAKYPGPVMDIKLERKNKLIFYKIDIADNNGIVKTLTINAQSGQLIQPELVLAKKKGSKKRATATN